MRGPHKRQRLGEQGLVGLLTLGDRLKKLTRTPDPHKKMASFAPPDEFAAAAFAKWTNTPGADSEVYLVYGGATGWLGGLLVTLLKDSGKTVHIGEARLENREAILRVFE